MKYLLVALCFGLSGALSRILFEEWKRGRRK